jgi:hypothetical protein
MEKFSAEAFYQIGKVLQRISDLLDFAPPPGDAQFSFRPPGSIPLTANESSILKQELEKAIPWCEGIGLELTLKHLRRVVNSLPQQPTRGRLREDIRELDSRIHDEIENCLFMHIPGEKANYYREPLHGWEEVVKRFPQACRDIEEANRSFACGLYAAAVFHAMLVVEFGLIEIGKLIDVGDPKPGWNSTIGRIDQIVNKTKYPDLKPAEQKYRRLLEQLLPTMRSMDGGWRDKISHADNKLVLMTSDFDDRVAKMILENVCMFMLRLATDLSGAG